MGDIYVITHIYNEIEVPFLINNKTNKKSLCHENPERNICVTDYLKQNEHVILTYVAQASDLEERLREVHDLEYIAFLRKTSEQLGKDEYVLNHGFAPPYVKNDTPVVRNTYKQACMSASAALTAAKRIAVGANCAYALCRPPGHHAGKRFMGGYCYFNNAAIAAETLLQEGYKKVGIFDIDYHIGNGTYDIVQNRNQIVFGSLHASVENEYPYHRFQERENCFLYEFVHSPTEKEYLVAFTHMLEHFMTCEAIIVSLGYDIIQGDPHGNWGLRSDIYQSIGRQLKNCGLPVCLIQEGGYSVENMLDCVKNIVNGLSGQKEVSNGLVE